MPLTPQREPEIGQPVHPKRPLFERIQDWIFKLDMGQGVQWFRLGLFCILVLLVILFYTGTQFYGLHDREAMDLGQLARNLARGRGYVTENLRPLDIWYLNSIGRPIFRDEGNAIPELWTPPVYPLVLSVFFRALRPEVDLTEAAERLRIPKQQLPALGEWQKLELLYDSARTQSLRMDRYMVIAAWVFFLVGMVLLYLLARELFDHRVAMLSVFLYLFCDPLLSACVNGLPTCFLAVLFLLAVYGVFKAEKWAEAGKSRWWIYGALAMAAVAVGLGTLTQYAFVSVLVPLLVYVTVSFRKQRWYAKVGLCLAVYILVLSPWVVRNWRVSETLFGLARFELSEGVRVGFMTEVKPGQLQRAYGIEKRVRLVPIIKKTLANGRQLYESEVKDIGANYLFAFFLASLLHRFRREEVFRLRRLVFWSLLVCVAWLAVAGVGPQNPLTFLFPLISIYGCAFFFVVFERLQFRTRLLRRGMVGLFAAVNMLPFVFTILPPSRALPYPPYDGGVVAAMGNTFRDTDLMVSDIPWAVAWYADRAAVWAPFEEKDYLAINDNVRVIAGIYLTQATLQQMHVLDMVTGYQKFWLDKFRPPPPDFPLQFFRPLTPDGQQVLLSNRAR